MLFDIFMEEEVLKKLTVLFVGAVARKNSLETYVSKIAAFFFV